MNNKMEDFIDRRVDTWKAVLKILQDLHVGVEGDDEVVNSPSHYQSDSGIEVIDVIEAFKLNFNLANAVKYILRSGKKGDALQDIQKAIWYLKREKLNFGKEFNDEV